MLISMIVVAASITTCSCKNAPLTALEGSVLYLSSTHNSVSLGGSIGITITGYKGTGAVVADGTMVYLTTNLGTIDSPVAINKGQAYAQYKAPGDVSGEAKITARSGFAQSVPESLTILVGSSAVYLIRLSLNGIQYTNNQASCSLKCEAFDRNGSPLPNISIRFSTTNGSLASSGNAVSTNHQGVALDTLLTTEDASVSVLVGGLEKNLDIKLQKNEKPQAAFSFSPSAPTLGEPVVLNAQASSDADGRIVSYQWDLGDGGVASGVRVIHRYWRAGKFLVTLIVIDDRGMSASLTKDIQVFDQKPPVADFYFYPQNPVPGQAVVFNGSASRDPDGTIVLYHWDFGDGSVADGAVVSHAYVKSGTFKVRLLVEDEFGLTHSKELEIKVNE